MAGISFDGMASGLDTTSLVKAIISAERMPVLQMESKLAAGEARVDGLRAINSQVAALATKLKQLSTADGFRPATGTSSHEGVTLKVGTGATPTALTFSVDAVAAQHSGVSAAMSGWDGEELVITKADGTAFSFNGTSLSDIASQINNSTELGVSATLVKAGLDADGNALYRLQLTSNETGAANSFTATKGGTDMFSGLGAVTSVGSDAQITLFPGTGAAQTVTSTTNEFSELATGVSVTVTQKAVGTTVNASVSNDATKASAAAEDMMKQINALLSTLKQATAVSASSGTGGSKASASIFTGDSTIRSLTEKIFSATTRPKDGSSQAWLGIEPDRFGGITVNADKLREAIAADPAKASAALSELASRVSAVATEASDKYTGVLTRSIESRVQDNTRTRDSIDSMDRRLEVREASLKRQFVAMELALAKAKDLSSYLSGQFALYTASAGRK